MNCHRCGSPGKRSRDEAETLFCPRCGIWLEQDDEIITEPSNEAPLLTEEEACAPIKPTPIYSVSECYDCKAASDAWGVELLCAKHAQSLTYPPQA